MRLLLDIRMILRALGIIRGEANSSNLADLPGVQCLPIDPDQPASFGYKMSWIAVRTDDAEGITQLLRLRNVRPCGWHEGISTAYECDGAHVFLTPTIDGWTCAVGFNVGGIWDDEKFRPSSEAFIRELSHKYGIACMFSSHRVSSAYMWMRADRGVLNRAFYSVDGEAPTARGEPTPE